ncbi:hypothetical protein TWF718_001228 [Orbilia javanica]|uniref:UBC core domain-containing protein n=1 Tax=Orbilia javanica TaxID=47235 RepID=A0AAN8MYB2_9PEZI
MVHPAVNSPTPWNSPPVPFGLPCVSPDPDQDQCSDSGSSTGDSSPDTESGSESDQTSLGSDDEDLFYKAEMLSPACDSLCGQHAYFQPYAQDPGGGKTRNGKMTHEMTENIEGRQRNIKCLCSPVVGPFSKNAMALDPKSYSLAIGQRRKASVFLSPPTSPDLQEVQLFFAWFLGEERSATLQCPHGASALSSIFAIIKSDDRKKGGSLPYSHDGKTCFFRCSDCKMIVCAGCGSKIGKTKTAFIALSHTCIDSHLLSIVLVLAKIDARWYLKEFGPQNPAPRFEATASNPLPAQAKAQSSYAPPFVSFPNSRFGTGYGTGRVFGKKPKSRRVVKTATKIKQEFKDNIYLTELLGHLVELMKDEVDGPSRATLLAERGGILVSIIKISYLPEFLGSLARNDSIMDIDASNSWETYGSCLDLFRIFSAHDILLEILVATSMKKKSSPGIANLIKMPDLNQLKGFAPNKKRRGILSNLDPVEFALAEEFDGTGESIVQSFQRLAKQCQAFLGNASRAVFEDGDDETERLLLFCSNVDATAMEIDKRAKELERRKDQMLPPPHYKSSNLAPLSQNALLRPIFSSSRSLPPMKFRESDPLEVPPTVQHECRKALSGHLKFKYSNNVVDTHNGTKPYPGFSNQNAKASNSAPGRMRRLVKEITVLSTALPPGIFVRVQEDRLDLFKVLIVGPEFSPYQLGLFEFDFTIPLDYPNTPPLVMFKTTGNGIVRFNPNLYESGKVCLSILGTWSGSASEQWQPKTSTLLQVLVSIQSMILCAEPYYNEPGYEKNPNPKASKMYNEIVQLNNLQFAMANWLIYPLLWDDVVQTHFLAYSKEILSTAHNFVKMCEIDHVDGMETPPLQQCPPADSNKEMEMKMEHARDGLLYTMKERFPSFLGAGLWKDPSD